MKKTKTRSRAATKSKRKVTAFALRKPATLARRPPVRTPKRVKAPPIRRAVAKVRHLVVDAALRDLAGQMSHAMFDFMDLAAEVVKDNLHVRMHYQDVESYFDQRIGYRWRSLRRRLAIHEAVQKLEEGERREARAALIGLKIHRAATLAPVFDKPGQDWREWVKRAERLDEKQLQEQVSKALGLKKRGAAPDDLTPDDRWYKRTIGLVPEDARAEIEDIFDMGLVLLGETDKIPRVQVLMNMARECSVEWRHQAEEKGWTSKAARV